MKHDQFMIVPTSHTRRQPKLFGVLYIPYTSVYPLKRIIITRF